MKLVISYHVDRCLTNYCVEDESVESFTAKFIQAFNEWVIRDKKRQLMHKFIRPFIGQRDAPEYKIWDEYVASGDFAKAQVIIIEDYSIIAIEDYVVKEEVYTITYMPEILTLEDWVTANSPIKEAK